jgi:MFS family permease
VIEVLRNRNFSLLWVGQLISLIGDWVLIAALPFYVFDITGSALSTGFTFIAMVVPSVLFGSIAGVFVDRWNRKRTMIIADGLRSGVLLLLILVHSREQLWLVYVAAFLESTISQFFGPAKNAIIPQLVEKENLMKANSLTAMNDNAARLVGPSVGGALLGVVGLYSVALLDSASFLISALLIFFISQPSLLSEEKLKADERGAGIWTMTWKEWSAELSFVGRERLVRGLFTVAGMGMLADSILTVLIVVFVKEILHVGALQFGWLMTARGLGGLVGGIIVARLSNVLKPPVLMRLGFFGIGLILLLTINFPSFYFTLILIALAGIPAMAWMISEQTMLQSSVEDKYRGRLFGTYATTVAIMTLVGMGFGSVAGDLIGAVLTLNISALLYIAAGVAAIIMLRGVE